MEILKQKHQNKINTFNKKSLDSVSGLYCRLEAKQQSLLYSYTKEKSNPSEVKIFRKNGTCQLIVPTE